MKVRKVSLANQLFLMFTILLLVGDVILGAVIYKNTSTMFMKKVQENALNLSQCAAASVDADAFERVVKSGAEAEFDEIYVKLSLFLNNSSLLYVYSFAVDAQGNPFFVVDTDEEDPAEFGEMYDEMLEGMEIAFAGESAVDSEPSSDEWGTYISAYSPVLNKGKVVGIVGVDLDYTEIEKDINRLSAITFFICLVVYLFLLAALIWMRSKLKREFTVLNDKINELADGSGDLNKTINIKTGDEFEVIGDSINAFILQLKNLIHQIVSSSNENANSIRSINNNTHAISASMEECSASTEMISDQLGATAMNVEQLAKNVEEANGRIREAYERAKVASQTAISHKEESEKYIHELQKDIERVMQQAEAVEKVQKINREILSIVNATKILSLNAEIEAARAGDAGLGFEVVAKQIAALSDDISAAVVDINDINAQVILAMNDMVSYLENMNEFLNGAVTEDYEAFAEIGRDYGETSEVMQDTMQALKNQSSEIAVAVVGVSNSIQEISKSVSDSAGQVEQLCGSTIEISDEINKLLDNPIMKY